jgi:hypothetical protein
MNKTFFAGQTLTFKDLALGLLFPTYWATYRSRCSKQNVFKIKILDREENINEIYLMEVSPVDGMVIVPNGISTFVSDAILNIAIGYTYKEEV